MSCPIKDQAMTLEARFLQAAVLLAAKHKVGVEFTGDNVMYFDGDEMACIACVDELAAMFPRCVIE